MTTITNIRKNIMGTISFDAKFNGMRKPQDFIVYPNPAIDRIVIQSDSYMGEIAGGSITYSRAQHSVAFMLAVKRYDVIDNIEELRAAIRGTASKMAGSSGIVFVDNSSAAEV